MIFSVWGERNMILFYQRVLGIIFLHFHAQFILIFQNIWLFIFYKQGYESDVSISK